MSDEIYCNMDIQTLGFGLRRLMWLLMWLLKGRLLMGWSLKGWSLKGRLLVEGRLLKRLKGKGEWCEDHGVHAPKN